MNPPDVEPPAALGLPKENAATACAAAGGKGRIDLQRREEAALRQEAKRLTLLVRGDQARKSAHQSRGSEMI